MIAFQFQVIMQGGRHISSPRTTIQSLVDSQPGSTYIEAVEAVEEALARMERPHELNELVVTDGIETHCINVNRIEYINIWRFVE